MATLLDVFNLRSSDSLRTRIAAACWKAAGSVLVESDLTPNHAARLTWAKGALADTGGGWAVAQMLSLALLNTELQAAGEAASDTLVQYCVDANIDAAAAAAAA